jgi:hypothetical protein
MVNMVTVSPGRVECRLTSISRVKDKSIFNCCKRSKKIGVSMVILFLIILVFSNIKTCVKAEAFSTNIRVDDTGLSTSFQGVSFIAIDNKGIIHIVFGDWRDDADGKWEIGGGVDGVNNKEIYYANSTDGGQTFGIEFMQFGQIGEMMVMVNLCLGGA